MPETVRQNGQKSYGVRTIFYGISSLILSALSVYHLCFRFVFINIGHLVPSWTEKLPARLPSFATKVIGGYINYFEQQFGRTPAAHVLMFLLPITVIFVVLFALNLEEYLESRKNKVVEVPTTPERTEDTDGQSAV